MDTPSPNARVSVALCTYNGARYIEAQLRSILDQAEHILEVVVADDGSADDTLARVRAVADSAGAADRIRILEGGGHGVTANFERAVRACRGELIALSDQDDVWLPDRLAAQLAALDADPDTDLLFGDADLVGRDGEPLGARLFEQLEVTPELLATFSTGDGFDTLLRRNVVTGATVMFRRRLLRSALPFPAAWVHDEWLAIVAAAVSTVTPLDRPIIRYRQHGANEIGVTAPTLRNKVRRVLQPRGTRNLGLATRSEVLATRLTELGAPARIVDAARAKARFERFRADLPAARVRRLRPVLKLARSGGYRRYASQGTLDIVRDLAQPAG